MAGLNSLDEGAKQLAQAPSQGPSQEQLDAVKGGLNSIQDPGELTDEIKNDPEKFEAYKTQKQLYEVAQGAIRVIEGYGQLTSGMEAGANRIVAGLEGTGTEENPGLIPSYQQIDGGIKTVAGKMQTLSSSAEQLNNGAQSLKTGVNSYTAGVSQVGQGVSQVQAGMSALNEKVPALVEGVSKLSGGADQLESGAKELRNGVSELHDGTDKLAGGASSLHSGTVDLVDGTTKLKDGTVELADGTTDLKDGTVKLRDGVVDLVDGVSQLVDGTGKLKDGVIEFNDEGISKIVDLIDNDLENYYDRLCAVRDFADEYTSFTTTDKNSDNTVKFIYKMDAVE